MAEMDEELDAIEEMLLEENAQAAASLCQETAACAFTGLSWHHSG
jgi:hypothetical protein